MSGSNLYPYCYQGLLLARWPDRRSDPIFKQW
jgi:hypothetical protein